MKKNMGSIDRIIRALVGIAGLAAYFLGMLEGTWAIVALVVGVVMLGTSAMGWCPPYAIFGISSCSVKSEDA